MQSPLFSLTGSKIGEKHSKAPNLNSWGERVELQVEATLVNSEGMWLTKIYELS